MDSATKINADFNQRVVVHSQAVDWIDSPMMGVQRKPLDRIGDEVARATTIVRYAPGSHFSPHVHAGGEEFLVLDGVFQDEHGDFPAGSYIRNPIGTSHTPGSEPGCIILVKLWQFESDDDRHVRIHTDHMSSIPHRDFPGVSAQPLFETGTEQVMILDFDPDAEFVADEVKGAEVYVISGNLLESGENLDEGSWLRLPVGATLKLKAGETGARVWIKLGHLENIDKQIERIENQLGSH